MKSSILDDGQMTAILQSCPRARHSVELPYSAPKMTPAHTAVPSGRRISTALLMKSFGLSTVRLQKRYSSRRHRYHNYIGDSPLPLSMMNRPFTLARKAAWMQAQK
jgi:hypothetical protein